MHFFSGLLSQKSLRVISTLTTFAEATENECINDRHCQRTHATYISAKTDNLCSAVSLRELNYLFFYMPSHIWPALLLYLCPAAATEDKYENRTSQKSQYL